MRTGDSVCCTETGSTAVPSRLKAELGSFALEGQCTENFDVCISFNLTTATILQLPARGNLVRQDCRYITDILARDPVWIVCQVIALVSGSQT